MTSVDRTETHFLNPVLHDLVNKLDSATKNSDLKPADKLLDATNVEIALRQQAASHQTGDPFTQQELYDRLGAVIGGFRNGMHQLRDPEIVRFYYSIGGYPVVRADTVQIAAASLIPNRLVPPPPPRRG
jgi:hypothetical protein